MLQEIHLPLDLELPPAIIVQAGTLSCMYEAGKLRYIRHGKTELVRMVYAPVRNGHWATLECTIADEKITAGKDSFSIQYTAIYQDDIDVYKAYINIEGHADNRILFSMKGEALQSFEKNRIGICVLHPVNECAGRAVLVTRPDGNTYESVFPELVSPQQPLLDIQAMEWTTADNTRVQIDFTGDIFETEDQRNWSDSSYKTYSTPLCIPFPVNIAAGDTMEQQISITVSNPPTIAGVLATDMREEKILFPKIGYSRSAGQPPLSTAEIVFLQKIPFHHYRVSLSMWRAGWQKELSASLTEAVQLNVRLELVVFFSDQFTSELNFLLPLLLEKPARLYSILVLQKDKKVTPPELLAQVHAAIKKVLPALLVGYGTDTNFVELNRAQPVAMLFDFVSYALHPQAHMVDARSILDNLDNQPDMILTAGRFAPGKKIFVSPVTISNRDGAGADKRQYSAFAAWWLLMSLQQLSIAGSITGCELFGEAGLLRLNKNDKGQTTSIQPSIAYEMLAAVHAFQPLWIIKRYAGKNPVLDELLLENENGARLVFKAPDAIACFSNR